MATEIKTEILISASPEKVWAILNDFGNYPNWNPFITSLTGDVKTVLVRNAFCVIADIFRKKSLFSKNIW